MTVVNFQHSLDEAIAYFESFSGCSDKDADYDTCCKYFERCSTETVVAFWNYSWRKLLELHACEDGTDGDKMEVFVNVTSACDVILLERNVSLCLVQEPKP